MARDDESIRFVGHVLNYDDVGLRHSDLFRVYGPGLSVSFE
jgi:hypothetical protein